MYLSAYSHAVINPIHSVSNTANNCFFKSSVSFNGILFMMYGKSTFSGTHPGNGAHIVIIFVSFFNFLNFTIIFSKISASINQHKITLASLNSAFSISCSITLISEIFLSLIIFFAMLIIFSELSIPIAFFTLNSSLAIDRLVPSPHPR